jgi:hypothetical protein
MHMAEIWWSGAMKIERHMGWETTISSQLFISYFEVLLPFIIATNITNTTISTIVIALQPWKIYFFFEKIQRMQSNNGKNINQINNFRKVNNISKAGLLKIFRVRLII